ncbi:MAG: cytochrome c oxidase subunit II [Gammaproteobacteria bacterium]
MKQKYLTRSINLLLGLATIASQNVWAEVQPYNLTKGVTSTSESVFGLHMLVTYICLAIAILVFAAMAITLIRDRKSRGVTPAKFHESTFLEFIWTTIPFVILIAIAIPSTAVLVNMEDVEDADMTIKITGYQWLWRYEYVDHNIDYYSVLSTPREQIYNQEQKNENYLLQVDNELVLPTNRKVRFLITASDVIHSWWVPDLGFKKDAIPGFINEAWTKINEPGIYRGQCAELCGRDHGFMPVVVRAIPPEEFDQWVMQQSDKNIASSKGNSTSLSQITKKVATAEGTKTAIVN